MWWLWLFFFIVLFFSNQHQHHQNANPLLLLLLLFRTNHHHNSCNRFLAFSQISKQQQQQQYQSTPTFTYFSSTPSPCLFSTTSHHNNDTKDEEEDPLLDGETDGWEEEDEEEGVESKAGDGGDGGGVVLQNLPWGERALSTAYDVLLQFGDDLKIFFFKTTPRGYVYTRLDKLSNQFGCPAMEDLEGYCQEYKRRLEEVGALGEIPNNLALEVSSPSAERILKVPDDLSRFRDMPMRVWYIEGGESNGHEKGRVFLLDLLDVESENCIWKLADVKENKDPQSKGRPLSRGRRDWRLKLPFEMHRKITLYLDC